MYRPFMVHSGLPADTYSGTSIELMHILAEKINYCYYFTHIDGLVSGKFLANGTWTDGVIRRVMDGEFAFAGVPMSLTQERLASVDFSHYIQVDEHTILTQYPTMEADYAGFIKPLSNLVRHIIITILLLLIIDIATS